MVMILLKESPVTLKLNVQNVNHSFRLVPNITGGTRSNVIFSSIAREPVRRQRKAAQTGPVNQTGFPAVCPVGPPFTCPSRAHLVHPCAAGMLGHEFS